MDRNLYRNFPIEPDEDDYGFPASSYDCTGLIPKKPENEDELEAYEDIYPYLPSEDEDFQTNI